MIGGMDISVLKFLLWVAFGGWVMYLSSERKKIVDDVKTMKAELIEIAAELRAIDARVSSSYLTKTEHRDFDNRISASIDRLAERIDKVLIWKGKVQP